MKKIGIIAAMEPEMNLILQSMEDVYENKAFGISFFSGLINNKEIVLSLCGVGKVNASIAATLLISNFECDFIINTGIAGGVSPLETKDVVIADALTYSDFDTTIFGYDFGQVPGMPRLYCPRTDDILMVKRILLKEKIDYKIATIYTADRFISSLDYLPGNVSGVACEMEGTAIAQTCVRAGVDFIVIRFISDIIGAPNQINDYKQFEKEMAEKSAKITFQIVNNL